MKAIILCIMVFAAGLSAPQITQAQGTLFVSNLGQTSIGSSSVGSNSWYAADFITGTNANGYMLDSIELGMTNAAGSPSGFTVMIYNTVIFAGRSIPGIALATLSGSTDPSVVNIYTYTPASSLTLSPNTGYFIVLTAGTSVANGAYEWSVTSTPSLGFNSYNWGGETSFLNSINGINWNNTSGIYGQFAIDATAAPEPSSSWLLLLGSGIFIY